MRIAALNDDLAPLALVARIVGKTGSYWRIFQDVGFFTRSMLRETYDLVTFDGSLRGHFICKPVVPGELGARIQSLLRRVYKYGWINAGVLGDWRVSEELRLLKIRGPRIDLTPHAFDLALPCFKNLATHLPQWLRKFLFGGASGHQRTSVYSDGDGFHPINSSSSAGE